MNQLTQTGNLPNLVIIGAMKSGTTSLHYYLNLHPDIFMSGQKELNFFVKERNWDRGVDWYKSHFTKPAKIYGESSPQYTKYPICQGVPERMFSVIPQAKLIYIIRNPIERIISHYIHLYSIGRENRSLEEALGKCEENFYLQRSQYFLQLQQYLQFFSKSNILVITSEQLLNSPQKTMHKVFLFLEVDPNIKFEFNLQNMFSAIKLGKFTPKSILKFNKKIHQSSQKRRLNIATNSSIVKTVTQITSFLPPEFKYHLEKIIYRPFSQKIKQPQLDNVLQEKILTQLKDDIDKMKEYTGYDFKEWNLN